MGCDNMENQVLIGRVIGKLSNQIYRNIAISCSSTNMSGTQGRVLHFILSNNGMYFKKILNQNLTCARQQPQAF